MPSDVHQILAVFPSSSRTQQSHPAQIADSPRSPIMSDDPFLQVQADVLSLLDTTRPLFTSYIRIRSSAASPSNPQLVEAREELESNLTDLSTDLQDLIDSVKAVEGDPYKYGIDIDEVSRRRRFVQDIGAEIEDMHQQLNQTVSKAPLAHPDSFGAAEGEEDDDEYGQFQEQRQMEMMHEQDQALDGVFQTVGNLRLQEDTMGRELEEQADMLDDVDNITERVGGKLQTGMKKINFVIRQNEGKHAFLNVNECSLANKVALDTWSSCCIGVLIFVLIILLVILLTI